MSESAELENFFSDIAKQLDSGSAETIRRTLIENGFKTRLQLKLIGDHHLDAMFGSTQLNLGAKSLLSYYLKMLKDDSPLPVKKTDRTERSSRAQMSEGAVGSNAKRCLPILQGQLDKLKKQLTIEKQDCRELEMNVESMTIDVKEPPAMGSSKLVCGHCHHRGHRNSNTKPCELTKCTEYTYCGIKDKHPEYFSKLNSFKVELKKKKSAIKEIETQIQSMEEFSTNSEFDFVKAMTQRMYNVDPQYKTNKAKLMRDVRLLRNYFDGKIPSATPNDAEQLKIALSKCKKEIGIPNRDEISDTKTLTHTETVTDKIDLGTSHEFSPIKMSYQPSNKQDKILESDADTSSEKKSEPRKKRRKNKKHRKPRKRYSSSSSSDSSSSTSSNDKRYKKHRAPFPSMFSSRFNLPTPPVYSYNPIEMSTYGFYHPSQPQPQPMGPMGIPQQYQYLYQSTIPTYLSSEHDTNIVQQHSTNLNTLAHVATDLHLAHNPMENNENKEA